MKLAFDGKRALHNKTGLGNYSRSLIQILSTYYPSHQYLVYSPKPSDKYVVNTPKNVEVLLPSTGIWKKLSSIWRQQPIVNQIISDEVALYHGLSGELPIGLSKKVKTVVTIHDLIFMRYPKLYRFFDRKIYFWKFKQAAKNASKVIAISQQTKEDIIKYLKIPKEKIQVVYQTCHPAFKKTYSIVEKENVGKKYALPKKFILYVGTIEARKNALTIVKAIKDTKQHLVLIGKEEARYAKQIRSYITTNKMENQVIFLKNINTEELAIIYQLATIFCYPSIFEGFGIPIIEALYSKTPVITSNCSCFPEAAGPNAKYITPTDVAGLKNIITALWNDTEVRLKIATESYQYAQKFNDEVVAQNIMNIYREVLQS